VRNELTILQINITKMVTCVDGWEPTKKNISPQDIRHVR
jgi:hypothetical protein